MKKKWLLGLMTASSLLLAACGGGGGGETSDDTASTEDLPTENIEAELTVQAEEEWVPYYEAAIERVKESNPNANITIKTVGSMDHLEIIDNTDATNEDVADVFAMPADRLYNLSDNEVLGALDAEGMAERIGGFENFGEGLGGQFEVDGEYLAFPMNIETLIVYANTANAEANGVDLSSPVELTESEYDDILIPVFDAWYGVAVTNSSDIELLGKQDDGTLYSDLTSEWGELPAEKQATISALYDYWAAHDEAGTALFDADAGWGYIDQAFTSGGEASLRLGGPWDAAPIAELANDGADLEVYPIEQITVAGQPLAHWKGGWGHAINSRIEADPNQVALAQVLIEELQDPEYAAEFFEVSGKIMPNATIEQYQESDLEEADKKVIEATIQSYEASENRPLFSEWDQVWDTWKNSLLSWNSVKPQNEEEAYAEIKAAFDAMMANFNQ